MDLVALRAELDAGHPDTGAYSANDATATDELNAVNRPGPVPIEEVLRFLVLDNTHSTDGDDTQDRAIWTRLKDVEALYEANQSSAKANPWGSTAIGSITEIRIIKSAQLLAFFTLSAQGGLAVDVTDSNFQVYLAGAEQAGCLSAAQETALLALDDDRQSRAVEIGLGNVLTRHVTAARAL